MNRVLIVPAGGAGTTWEEQYQQALARRGIGNEGFAEIRRCTDEAFAFITPAAFAAPNAFASGVVVGAVQSGKTSLMINFAARALDSGFRCIIVLAGLRDDLRTQTAIRFNRDLLQKGDPIPEAAGGGFTHPEGVGYHGIRRDCWSPAPFDDVNHDEAFAHLVASKLRKGQTVLAVAKKNLTTLSSLRSALQYALHQTPGSPLPLLVIDDECDEASVGAEADAPTPERIAELWSGLEQSAAYIGFTATPAANLLQEPSSLLFPGHFVVTLRSPGDRVSMLSYFEPDADRRYTGGSAFYEFLEGQQRENFLVEADMSLAEFQGDNGHDEALEEALLSYLVSGAIRLVEQGLPSFRDADNAPRPHTMLAHTESTILSHWRLCERIMGIVRRNGGREETAHANIARIRPQDRILAVDLEIWLQSETDRWKQWHDEFRKSRLSLLEISPDRSRSEFPEWEQVCTAFPTVFDAVKLRVVNSDDSSVDPPLQFNRTFVSGRAVLPRDIYSIIIGGNRLSRGLTIEGLCTAYYTRTAAKLVEDTTVQRERWFGYRGSHLEFCRVFTHRSLALRLRRFHEHDEDLRRQLAWNIAHSRTPADAAYRFLTIRDSKPTSKLGRGAGPLRIDASGSRVFVDRVQMGEGEPERAAALHNERHAREVSEVVHLQGKELRPDGTLLGYVREKVAAVETADLLDTFSYTFHNPDPRRGIGAALDGYYRQPAEASPVTDYRFAPSSDPYLIAAFLRYWAHAYEECSRSSRPSRFRATDGVSDWRPCPPPTFNIGIRYGSLEPAEASPFDFPLLDRDVDPEGVLGSRWGGRRGGIGDEWIDMGAPAGHPDAPRPLGAPGLVLLHIVARQAMGRSGHGTRYIFDRPCLGIVIPEGGPSLELVLATPSR